jgi:formylglycine-generating enzyme required for sulfatase activity
MTTTHEILRNRHPLARGIPPAWAWEWGEDRYGPWCLFRVKGVDQRLRWIPPGQFLMGSPPEEAGRYDWEGPQQSMRIPSGFWLFDTPCTQELWEAVMDENPSRFRSPTRPVEQVSWEDCQTFVKRLNSQLEGLELSLLSEAQWEYACRAGTTGATYAGDLEILGANKALLLDGIAWYGGNCGVDYELADGFDISSWPEKQYDSKTGGSHPVGGKAPNAWGLYDMLGNVWEWCMDKFVDRPGKPASADRVFRGGSWSEDARVVRAAVRVGYDLGLRITHIGFRCGEYQAGELIKG